MLQNDGITYIARVGLATSVVVAVLSKHNSTRCRSDHLDPAIVHHIPLIGLWRNVCSGMTIVGAGAAIVIPHTTCGRVVIDEKR